jgi:hypothetical protein
VGAWLHGMAVHVRATLPALLLLLLPPPPLLLPRPCPSAWVHS